jgi:hypothetical protein
VDTELEKYPDNFYFKNTIQSRESDVGLHQVEDAIISTEYEGSGTTVEAFPLCQSNEFDCSDNQCIDLVKECDTLNDCENNYDEKDCDHGKFPVERRIFQLGDRIRFDCYIDAFVPGVNFIVIKDGV